MSDEPRPVERSRRAFLKTTALGAAAAGLPRGRGAYAAAASGAAPASPDTEPRAVSEGALFRETERRAHSPGGAAWRAFHFEGAMLGYGTYPPDFHASHGDGGTGPDSLGFFTRAALWVMGFFSRWIA